MNDNKETSKLCVVFNGSASTYIGILLKDLLHTSPKLQKDLMFDLLRFRQHSVVVCADVAKMLQLIWVQSEYRQLQKIIWRAHSDAKVKEYTLDTVTYGTKSVPYLSIRCFKE